MASYQMISYGSSGDAVRKLQNALNQKGYGLDEDGIFGAKTQAAVRDYQSKNNLSVDGIAGDKTWGSLLASSQPAQQAPQKTDYSDYTYDPSANEAYQNALKALEEANKNAPTYNDTYDQQLKDLYDSIVNREDFTYDLNSDLLYQQYRDQYTRLGQQAMQDTMGQAAALTGGYGSSYSQNAGQQTYNEYLAQLNNIVPDLYNQAYGRYQDEGTALQQQYGMLGDLAADEYNKYTDAYERWLANLQMAKDDADTAYDRGYTDYINALQMAYQKDRDAIADQQWQQEMAFQQAQFDYQKQQDALARSYSSGGSGGGSSGSSSYNNGGLTEAQVKELQNYYGVSADGMWGSASKEAAGGLTAKQAWENYSDDVYYVGNNIYSRSKGGLIGFKDPDKAYTSQVQNVRADLEQLKAYGETSRDVFRNIINQSELTRSQKDELIREYCN